MPFMTFYETMFIVLVRNIIFQKKIFEDFDIMLPVSFLVYILNKYVLYKIPMASFIVVVSIIVITLAMRNRGKAWTCITEVIVGVLAMGICEIIALGVTLVIKDSIEVKLISLNIFFIFVNYIIAIIILSMIPKRYYDDVVRSINKNNIFILLIVNLLLVMLICKLLFDNQALVGITGVQILLVVIILFLSTVCTYSAVITEKKEKDRLETENSFKPILEDYLNQLRASEHEYKNHLNAIYSMILVESDDDIKEKVQGYIGGIKKGDNLNKILYVDNVTLKAVLYSKLREAEDKGIRCDYNILSSLNDSPLNNTELVVVISNLLNNALEAAQDSEETWVKIDIQEKVRNDKKYYVVEVENSVDYINEVNISSIMNKGYTTKGEGRGFGLYNINKVMKRVNGTIIIEPRGGSICISLEF